MAAVERIGVHHPCAAHRRKREGDRVELFGNSGGKEMRKLSVVALIAGLSLLGVAGAAGATSVNMVWTGASSGTINGSSVAVSGTANATLTLDVQIDIDSRGLAAAFMTFDFDTDLGNELNLLSFSEVPWSRVNKKAVMGAVEARIRRFITWLVLCGRRREIGRTKTLLCRN